MSTTDVDFDFARFGGQTKEEHRESAINEIQSQLVRCSDPHCTDDQGRPSIAEPEQDGDHLYYECLTCGSQFGWERVTISTEPACSAGIPEAVRRAGSSIPGYDGAPGPGPAQAPAGTPVTLGRKGLTAGN